MSAVMILDAGTRSVILLAHEGGTITATHYGEHATSCMKEGNVYDLGAVISSIEAVRAAAGLPVGTEVAIAIAGGKLTTKKISARVPGKGPWTDAQIAEAESKALTKAAGKTDSKKVLLGAVRSDFRVDGAPKGSIVGLEGDRAEFQIIATYLPLESVKAKIGVIEKAGFRPSRIVVEPLAVCRAVFNGTLPSSPYAVIDIGAGTSDIAVISSAGIHGVASIPHAGDTITESISKKLGLDYLSADRVKRDADAEVTDIWGEKRRFTRDEIDAASDEGLQSLVKEIHSKMGRLSHGKAINGIVLVGGGSLCSGLAKRLAEAFQMPEERVRVRHSETIAGIADATGKIKGPSYVTALGILLMEETAFLPLHFTLDGATHFSIGRPRAGADFTVADAMELIGRDPLEAFGDPSPARVVDGAIIGGDPGANPVVTVDGVAGTLDSRVLPGATITVEKSAMKSESPSVKSMVIEAARTPAAPRDEIEMAPRADVEMTSRAAVEIQPTHVMAEEKNEGKPSEPLHSEQAVEPEKMFVTLDGKKIELRADAATTLRDLVALPVERSITVKLNGATTVLRDKTTRVWLDGTRIGGDDTVPPNSVLSTARGAWRVFELLDGISSLPQRITINGVECGMDAELDEHAEVVIS